MQEATEKAEGGDATFSILTPVDRQLGGAVREYELHPWVERSGRFGFWMIVVGMEDNTRSMAPYLTKQADIADHQGIWVRRVGGLNYPRPSRLNLVSSKVARGAS